MVVKPFLLGFTNSSHSIGIKFWNHLDLIFSRGRYSLRKDLPIWTAVETLHIAHLGYKKIKTQNLIVGAREITQWLRVLYCSWRWTRLSSQHPHGDSPCNSSFGGSSTNADLGWYYIHVVHIHILRHTYIYSQINRWMTSSHTPYTCGLWCCLRLCLLFWYLGIALENLILYCLFRAENAAAFYSLEAGCSHLSLAGISPRPIIWNKYFSFPHLSYSTPLLSVPDLQLSASSSLPLLTPPLHGVYSFHSQWTPGCSFSSLDSLPFF